MFLAVVLVLHPEFSSVGPIPNPPKNKTVTKIVVLFKGVLGVGSTYFERGPPLSPPKISKSIDSKVKASTNHSSSKYIIE